MSETVNIPNFTGVLKSVGSGLITVTKPALTARVIEEVEHGLSYKPVILASVIQDDGQSRPLPLVISNGSKAVAEMVTVYITDTALQFYIDTPLNSTNPNSYYTNEQTIQIKYHLYGEYS